MINLGDVSIEIKANANEYLLPFIGASTLSCAAVHRAVHVCRSPVECMVKDSSPISDYSYFLSSQ
ncbi:MAG: hypothetical protein ACLQBD_04675 [Syntrophobacteraceae bacterium]